MQIDDYPQEKFMRRAFELASFGRGTVSPNPMVGCVVVYNGLVIGEGFHHRYGQAHAEVHAIDSVLSGSAIVTELMAKTGKTPQDLLRESTLYVTLEPCSHYGKTPPCAQKIIDNGIPRVVVSCGDPNPEVNGRGIAMLRAAGVDVREHFLEAEGREMGRRFFTNVEKQRPYVILKWARSADGYIAERRDKTRAITGPLLQVLNHSYRVEEDAIMVGTGTLLADNPRLDARLYHGRPPLRISMDLHGRVIDYVRRNTERSLHFFDGTKPTVLFVHADRESEYACLKEKIGDTLKIVGLATDVLWTKCQFKGVHDFAPLNYLPRQSQSKLCLCSRLNENVPFQGSFSRLGKVKTAFFPCTRLNENVPFQGSFSRLGKVKTAFFPCSRFNENVPISVEEPLVSHYLRFLQQERIGSLIVEGGTELLQSFIDSGLWDEVRIFTSMNAIGSGYPAPVFSPLSQPVETAQYAGEWVHVYRHTADSV